MAKIKGMSPRGFEIRFEEHMLKELQKFGVTIEKRISKNPPQELLHSGIPKKIILPGQSQAPDEILLAKKEKERLILEKTERQNELKKFWASRKKEELTKKAIDLNLPKEEWEKLNKPDLIVYLVDKTDIK